MREILFRGKRIDNGEWVEGYITERTMIPENWESYMGWVIESKPKKLYDCDLYEVIPETVGQYTGLKDKNGKRIFEGDIVKHDFGEDQIGVQYAVVEYSDKYAAFMIKPLHDWMFCGKSDCEVIGNIHDNPELLEDT